MVLGVLVIAMISAATVSVGLYAMGYPAIIGLLAYPVVGGMILLAGLSLFGALTRLLSRPTVTDHLPVQRTTTPTVAARIFRSPAKDKLRS